jgi:hypothetical protein
MVTFVAAFLVVYAITNKLLDAFVIALPLAVGDYLIIRGLYPANDDLRLYNLEARRRVKKVLASVDHIDRMAKQVRDPAPSAGRPAGSSRAPADPAQQTRA